MAIEETSETCYMTKKEAASHLRISPRTLDRLVAEGKILSARVSRRRILFLREDLDLYVNKLFQESAR